MYIYTCTYTHAYIHIQWNLSCETTNFASDKWPFKRGGLSSGVEINKFMFRFALSSGLSIGDGLSSGWPLKRGSTVHTYKGTGRLTAFSVRMTRPSSWSSSPFMVTVKSMMEVRAEISGVYTGLGSLVVMYRPKPSITSHSLSPTFTWFMC